MSKTVFIKVRVTPEEKEAYQDAASARGKHLSDVIRDHLDKLSRKPKRKPKRKAGAA